jgi:hypothetical protein
LADGLLKRGTEATGVRHVDGLNLEAEDGRRRLYLPRFRSAHGTVEASQKCETGEPRQGLPEKFQPLAGRLG